MARGRDRVELGSGSATSTQGSLGRPPRLEVPIRSRQRLTATEATCRVRGRFHDYTSQNIAEPARGDLGYSLAAMHFSVRRGESFFAIVSAGCEDNNRTLVQQRVRPSGCATA
jgi:hypothetical protein